MAGTVTYCCERAVARHPENAGALGIPHLRVRAPIEHRIDDDFVADVERRDAGAERRHFARAVGAERTRQRDPRIQTLRNEDVAPIERARANADERFAAVRNGHGDFVEAQILRTADLVQSDRLHGGVHLPKMLSHMVGQHLRGATCQAFRRRAA